jgi:CRISPR/Cas system-associated exonuclease Cas4 (RecB family)
LKYAWLDKNKREVKTPPSEFTLSLFDNGHKVGELAKEYFAVDFDVTAFREDGSLDLGAMLRETEKHIAAGTRAIAEASFSCGGFFCSVDILLNNGDGSYDICEVKSSKRDLKKYKKYGGVSERYLLDAAYQQYVLEKAGVKVGGVFVVLLSDSYVRAESLELDKYFVKCDVKAFTDALQGYVEDKLSEIGDVLSLDDEPECALDVRCQGCDYFEYCAREVGSPSPFDVYNLKFEDKCKLYKGGVSFFDVPLHVEKLKSAALRQIEYYNMPNAAYIDKERVKEFLGTLSFPLYSLDFETYLATVPEFENMKTNEVVPFQYSLHIMKRADGDYRMDSEDVEERHFIDVSGADPRRAIAESLVRDIPFGACVIAYHMSTESGIVNKLAEAFPDLAEHLRSFTYRDPLKLFSDGCYYTARMGGKFSIKSVLPALYPDDPEMDYGNLEGSIKNGTQAMMAITRAKEVSEKEREEIERDLVEYCALDTFAIVKVLKKLYDAVRD